MTPFLEVSLFIENWAETFKEFLVDVGIVVNVSLWEPECEIFEIVAVDLVCSIWVKDVFWGKVEGVELVHVALDIQTSLIGNMLGLAEALKLCHLAIFNSPGVAIPPPSSEQQA